MGNYVAKSVITKLQLLTLLKNIKCIKLFNNNISTLCFHTSLFTLFGKVNNFSHYLILHIIQQNICW